MSDAEFAESNFEEVYARMMKLVDDCEIVNFTVPVNNMLKVDLLNYWQHTHLRYTPAKRQALYIFDKVMSAVHSLIF